MPFCQHGACYKARRFVDRFLVTISHDFKPPVVLRKVGHGVQCILRNVFSFRFLCCTAVLQIYSIRGSVKNYTLLDYIVNTVLPYEKGIKQVVHDMPTVRECSGGKLLISVSCACVRACA